MNKNRQGVSIVKHNGKGTGITVEWNRAFPSTTGNVIGYNIYMDTVRPEHESEFFLRTPAFLSTGSAIKADILDLNPGQMYRFAVRAFEYDPTEDLSALPTVNGLKVYPETQLASDIDADDLIIPVLDTSEFPSTGIVQIGIEWIQYSSVDDLNNELILTSILQRGFNGTEARLHTTDGYDGYLDYDGSVFYRIMGTEDKNTVVFATENKFDNNEYAFTLVDGYRQATEDLVNSDLSEVEDANEDFPSMDHSGWRRTDLEALLNGECVGSYFGGEIGCADDGYGNIGTLRGVSVQDRNTQRQEELLSLTGFPVSLLRKQWTNIRCYCTMPHQESPDARCLKCYGGGFVVSWNQVFWPRRPDGRIMVRFEPWIDQVTYSDSGLTPQDVRPNAWTLTIPVIHERDVLVRYDKDGNEEFRYEVSNVTRNALFMQEFGAQKMALQRIRKTDIIYTIPVFSDTSDFPADGTTTIVSSTGIPPHSHTWRRNEGSLFNMEQLTENAAGHNHVLRWNAGTGMLEVSTELGHTHQLIL